jgi:hypothetical protein
MKLSAQQACTHSDSIGQGNSMNQTVTKFRQLFCIRRLHQMVMASRAEVRPFAASPVAEPAIGARSPSFGFRR